MRRDLGHDADAAVLGEGDEVADVVLRVVAGVQTGEALREVGEALALDTPPAKVARMQMEDLRARASRSAESSE